jgi:SAM-dependent methyltransferase
MSIESALRDARTRYSLGEPRDVVFRDLVVSSILQLGNERAVVLDIGCGTGFDLDTEMQLSIGKAAGRFIGIEPDSTIVPAPFFCQVHQCPLEDAPIPSDSVHVAYALFVLEHVHAPERFFNKIYDCLVPGGIFWALTADSRHFFCAASHLAGRLRIKDRYLDRVRGVRGSERYRNYPTHYLVNSPRGIRRYAGPFRCIQFMNIHRIGQLDYYFPDSLKPIAHFLDRLCMVLPVPGSLLAVGLRK